MKKYLVVLAAMIMVIAMVGGAYAANTAQNVVTTAKVLKMCTNGTDGTLAFADIDPSTTDTVIKDSTNLTYKCSAGTTFQISGITGGSSASGDCTTFLGTMKDGGGTGTHTLNYNLTCTATGYTGTGFSTGVPVTLHGAITSTQFQNAFVGSADNSYTDTVVVTIAY